MFDWLFSAPLPTGTQAPDFDAIDQDGYPVRLAELRGKNVVLIFYPADETSVCRQQLCEFRDLKAEWSANDTVVFGVNPQSARSHQKFREKRALGFPLLVDHGQQIAKRYRANGLFVRRTVYLIGKDGRINYGERGKPSPEKVLASATL
jgi:peroxiredoxin Q/BCP